MRARGQGPLLAYAALLAAAWAPARAPAGTMAGEPIALSGHAVALHTENELVDRLGPLAWRGGLEIRSPDSRFGGISAIGVSPDGTRLLAITDRGHWIRARLGYDRHGRLARIGQGMIGKLPALPGRAGARLSDAEALARSATGIVVAFEQAHRLVEYRLDSSGSPVSARRVVGPHGMSGLPGNAGIEALVGLADGRFLAIAEGRETMAGQTRAWLGSGRGWAAPGFEVSQRFRPTGAALAAAGRVLVLERRFSWLGGMAARIKSVAAAALAPATISGGRPIRGTVLATLEMPFVVENFEGIATRRGADDKTLIYLASDDNFIILQRTLLLMFALDPVPEMTTGQRLPGGPGR